MVPGIDIDDFCNSEFWPFEIVFLNQKQTECDVEKKGSKGNENLTLAQQMAKERLLNSDKVSKSKTQLRQDSPGKVSLS